MSFQKVDCVYNGVCHLGEGPVWTVQTQQLYWTDIYQRRLWVYDPATQQSRIFWEGEHAADITSGYDEKGVFLGGQLYRYRASVQGRPEWLADFE